MSRLNTPNYKTMNWPAYNEALKCRGSLTIWFDPKINWNAPPEIMNTDQGSLGGFNRSSQHPSTGPTG